MESKRDWIKVIVAVRLLIVSLFLIMPAFWAYAIGIFVDCVDGVIIKRLLKVKDAVYQQQDKVLDTWLNIFALLFALFNEFWFTPILLALFIFRFAGQIVFWATKNKTWLIVFPNFFEEAYLFLTFTVLAGLKLTTSFQWGIVIGTIFIFKIWQELFLHCFVNHSAFSDFWAPLYRRIFLVKGGDRG